MKADILKPFVVIPLQDAAGEDVSYMESFARSSNSEMVYACDEQGNKLAFGLFVTDSFEQEAGHADIIKQFAGKDNEEIKNESSAEIFSDTQFVGAVEECVSEPTALEVEKNQETKVPKLNIIRVYKVNKGKVKKQSGRDLKSLKKGNEKVFRSKDTKVKASRNKGVSYHLSRKKGNFTNNTKKVKKPRRRNHDRSFKVPQYVKIATYQRKYTNILAFNPITYGIYSYLINSFFSKYFSIVRQRAY